MSFLFVDREITNRNADSDRGISLSIKFSDVFLKAEDGSAGEYLGTLQNLQPEPSNKDFRDYRFFDKNGNQGIYPFKANAFNDSLSFEEAKARLEQALFNGPQKESFGYAIVKVVQEGVNDQVPLYLNQDPEHGIWYTSEAPKLINMRYLQDLKKVFYEARQRNTWVDFKDLSLVEITTDMF